MTIHASTLVVLYPQSPGALALGIVCWQALKDESIVVDLHT